MLEMSPFIRIKAVQQWWSLDIYNKIMKHVEEGKVVAQLKKQQLQVPTAMQKCTS